MSTVTGLMRVKVPTHRDTPHTFHSLFKLALVHVPFEHCMFNIHYACVQWWALFRGVLNNRNRKKGRDSDWGAR